MRKLKKIIGLMCLVLYLCHHVSCNYFYHTHNFSWGSVTHSHPYLPIDDAPGHTHTLAQCNAINFINSQGFFAIEGFSISMVLSILLLTLYIPKNICKYEGFQLSLRGRSPPVC